MNSIDEFEIPPGEAMLHCECGYESNGFYFDDHAYGCSICAAVVFPDPLPFVYAPPNCGKCTAPLTQSDRIPTSRMTEVDAVKCPRCKSTSLHIHHFPLQVLSNNPADCTPDLGQIVHARTRQPQRDWEPFCFFSPRLKTKLALGVVIANRQRDSLLDAHHEFRTMEVDDTHLVVDYIRPLHESEWRWYFG